MLDEEHGSQTVTRTLKISKAEENAYSNVPTERSERIIKMFHYSGFPEDDREDHKNADSLLNLIHAVNTWTASQEESAGRTKNENIVVHCR